jgi:flagellar export protein FliJ
MAFNFRLQTLMKHRAFVLREAQSALGAAELAKRDILRQTEEMEETLRCQCELFEKEQQEGIGVEHYLNFKNYLELLERQLLELGVQLADASAVAEEKRTALVERDRSVKLLEKLKERARQIHGAMEVRKELKQADEISMAKEFRKRNAN